LQVLVDAFMGKVFSVNTAEMLRECMKMVANAWSLAQALDGLDEWTLAQVGGRGGGRGLAASSCARQGGGRGG
jgi:hypothetical protein